MKKQMWNHVFIQCQALRFVLFSGTVTLTFWLMILSFIFFYLLSCGLFGASVPRPLHGRETDILKISDMVCQISWKSSRTQDRCRIVFGISTTWSKETQCWHSNSILASTTHQKPSVESLLIKLINMSVAESGWWRNESCQWEWQERLYYKLVEVLSMKLENEEK